LLPSSPLDAASDGLAWHPSSQAESLVARKLREGSFELGAFLGKAGVVLTLDTANACLGMRLGRT
jgi:hypothetical protein